MKVVTKKLVGIGLEELQKQGLTNMATATAQLIPGERNKGA